jgi:heme-degrading monooxygenase HmoA
MVFRHWSGIARPDTVDAYLDYLRNQTFPAVGRLPGFVRATIYRRTVPRGIEILVVSEWQSVDAIRAFAGPDAETAVVPGNVHDMLVDYDRVARHYEPMR